MATWKEKYNKKYGYPKDKPHSLKDISKETGVSMKGIQQIYNKGIGAYKTNPESVRDNVKSKEQWAYARVYSAVMGGDASKVDAKELKMEQGGSLKNDDRLEYYKKYYSNLTPSDFSVDSSDNKIIITPQLMNEKDSYFKKGGKVPFNPDGSIKDKIVHASGEAGGMLVGKRHSKGGIKAINKSTGQPLEMEGGEVVITRNAVSDPQKRMFNGKYMTNRQILSAINESGGGVSFADGGEVPDEINVPDTEFSFGGQNMKAQNITQRLMKTGGVTCSTTYENGGEITMDDFPSDIYDARFERVLGGSTGAELYKYKGKFFVFKKGNSPQHFKEEYYANQIYQFLKIPVPKTKLFENGLLKEYIDDVRPVDWNNEDDARQILNGYVADAFLANWDIYKNDNILVSNKTGIPYRIDNGGALRYRAQGQPKDNFDATVNELVTLKEQNPQIEKFLDQRIIAFEMSRFFNIRPTILINLFKSFEGEDRLTDILGERIDYIKSAREVVEKDLQVKVGDIILINKIAPLVFKVDNVSGTVITVIENGFKENYVRENIELLVPKEKVLKEGDEVFYINYPLDNDVYIVDENVNGLNFTFRKSRIGGQFLAVRYEVVEKDMYGVKQVAKKTSSKNTTLDDIKAKVLFDVDKGFQGKNLFSDDVLSKKLLDEYNKLNDEFETLQDLLPLFQDSKDSDKRSLLISEMKRLRRRIDYDLYVEIKETQALTRDLFTPEGLLGYYFKQTTQSPVNKDLKPCNLPTPNGKKSKLPINAYLNVRTEQFKRWFGDWESAYKSENYVNCSVMIDEETKEPKMFFHGVRKFAGGRGSSAMGAGINRPFGDFNPTNFSASYFADNEEYAKFYAGTSDNLPKQERRTGFVYSVFLNIKNPIDVRPLGFETTYKDLLEYLAVRYGVIAEYSTDLLNKVKGDTTKNPVWNYIRNDELLLQTLRDYGYDGLFQIGDIPKFDESGKIIEDRSKWEQDNEYLTFSPNQVKSATVNKSMYLTIFDDIRFKKGGYVGL